MPHAELTSSTEILHPAQDETARALAALATESEVDYRTQHSIEPGQPVTRADYREEIFGDELYIKRDAAMRLLVAKYENHDAVTAKVRKYETPPHTRKYEKDHPLGEYQVELEKYRLLTEYDEQVLFRQMGYGLAVYDSLQLSGIESANEKEEAALIELVAAYKIVFNTNLRLVVAVTNAKVRKTDELYADYVQEGNQGLLKAISRFSVAKGWKFSTYAPFWIKNTVNRFEAGKSRTVHIPLALHDKWQKVGATEARLSAKLGRSPSIHEVAHEVALSVDELRYLQKIGSKEITSLNAPVHVSKTTGHPVELGETLAEQAHEHNERDQTSAAQLLAELAIRQNLGPRAIVIMSLRNNVYLEHFTDMAVETAEGTRTYEEIMGAHEERSISGVDRIGKLFGIPRRSVKHVADSVMERLEIGAAELSLTET